MQLYSTNNPGLRATLREAVLMGLAPDRGLFMPTEIPRLSPAQLEAMRGARLPEIGVEALTLLIGDDVPRAALEVMIHDALDFPIPLRRVGDHEALELFHGPTLAFKDVGARFMARLLRWLLRGEARQTTILVATSGDTGSAVARGFAGVGGIEVKVLYPRGKISPLQEHQIATVGGNVTALEVAGTFDDCQALVKRALADEALARRCGLTTANSINIARLLPQIVYYLHAWAQRPAEDTRPLIISVPSGNFGDLTAGLMARRMGLPVARFIAATNVNDVVPRYLTSGRYDPRPTRATISNAMDVARPSNFARIQALYGGDRAAISADVWGFSADDARCRAAIGATYRQHGYALDPHGAVGLLGLEAFAAARAEPFAGIFLETAHPAKFRDAVEPEIGEALTLPPALAEALAAPLLKRSIPNDYEALRQALLS